MKRYIDADKLKEAWYTKHNITAEDHGACFVGYSELPRLIDAQPTADVRENVRGEWVEITNETEEWYWHPSKCSVCGAEMLLSFDNFCPNCGADMRGGKE